MGKMQVKKTETVEVAFDDLPDDVYQQMVAYIMPNVSLALYHDCTVGVLHEWANDSHLEKSIPLSDFFAKEIYNQEIETFPLFIAELEKCLEIVRQEASRQEQEQKGMPAK